MSSLERAMAMLVDVELMVILAVAMIYIGSFIYCLVRWFIQKIREEWK